MRLPVVALVTLTLGGFGCTAGSSELAAPSSASQGTSPDGRLDAQELERFVDGVIDEQMQAEHIPGAAFVFVQNGEVVLAKGYGLANLERRQPVSAETTIFRIGSISKVFTTEAVMQLADRGELDLHADVNRYLKRVKVPATFAEPVTADHLLSHTAGFDEIRPGTQAPDQSSVAPLPDFLDSRLVRLWPPGRVPMYSTYGMTLAGALIEDISGLPFEDYLARNIWKPLGMQRTCITVPPELAGDVATGYEFVDGRDEAQAWEWYHTTPASSINSTAADMATWMIEHLHQGRFGDVRTMSEAAARTMHATHVTGHPGLAGLAYGFEEERYNDLLLLEHGGNVAGFSALVVLVPERDTGFFVVNHHENSNLRDQLKWAVLEHCFGPARKDAVPAPPPDFAARAHEFVGEYGWNTWCHSCEGRRPTLVMKVDSNADGTLSLNGHRWIEAEPGLFVRDDGASRIAFRIDGQGHVTHMFFGGFWVFERLSSPEKEEP